MKTEDKKVAIIDNIKDKDYLDDLIKIKNRIKEAQYKASVYVNSEMILAYHFIGTCINKRKEEYKDEKGYVKNLSEDLAHFKGFSERNLERMARFANLFTYEEISAQLVPVITWGTLIEIMAKCQTKEERIWYIRKTNENGWSRSKVIKQININAYHFHMDEPILSKGLKEYDNPKAKELIQSNYLFQFLKLKDFNTEREFKDKLIDNIIEFTNELGQGFALVSKEFKIEKDGYEYYLDLLFYNYLMHAFIVFEVKMGEYKYQDFGKLVFYVNLVDDVLKTDRDDKTIGILLCRDANKTIVKHTLIEEKVPMVLSKYVLLDDLKDYLQNKK